MTFSTTFCTFTLLGAHHCVYLRPYLQCIHWDFTSVNLAGST